MLILAIILFGMLVGAAAQLILGREGKGIDWTMAFVAGLVGSFVGGLLASLIAGDGIQLRAERHHRLHRRGRDRHRRLALEPHPQRHPLTADRAVGTRPRPRRRPAALHDPPVGQAYAVAAGSRRG